MIIQTGMRTDIPAFFSEWFINRIKEGYVLVRNPYNPLYVSEYVLSPNIVDLICFCTKNPGPMIDRIQYLSGYGMFWYITITCYEKDLEPYVKDKRLLIEDFKQISKKVGKNSVGWRYDPIIINEKYTVEYHLGAFERIASSLEGYTDICVISFVDIYNKTKLNAPDLNPVSKEDQLYLGKSMIEIATKYGMLIRPCGEGDFLEKYGADCSGCMTADIYERAIGKKLNIPKKRELRNECSCLMGVDIGAYNSCLHLCKYCYANCDINTVKRNNCAHDKYSPFILGNHIEGESIHKAEQKSWIDNQITIDMYLESMN